MHKWIFTVVVFSLGACLVLGCGDKDEDDDMDSGPDASTDTDVDTDADADTDSDSDTDTDTDTGTGEDPCSPNPCDTPPGDDCSSNSWQEFSSPGMCSVTDAGAAHCNYDAGVTDCGSQYCYAPLSGCVDCYQPSHCTNTFETCDTDAGVCECQDDSYEPNNSDAAASSTYSGTMVKCDGDDDWYVFDASMCALSSCGCEVNLAFTHADGDLNMQLFQQGSSGPISTLMSTTDNEYEHVFIFSGNVYVRVYGAAGVQNSYTLNIAWVPC